MEISVLVANFVTMFEWSLCDEKGCPMNEAPSIDREAFKLSAPKGVRFKYELRK